MTFFLLGPVLIWHQKRNTSLKYDGFGKSDVSHITMETDFSHILMTQDRHYGFLLNSPNSHNIKKNYKTKELLRNHMCIYMLYFY